jgi:hypothetical protein
MPDRRTDPWVRTLDVLNRLPHVRDMLLIAYDAVAGPGAEPTPDDLQFLLILVERLELAGARFCPMFRARLDETADHFEPIHGPPEKPAAAPGHPDDEPPADWVDTGDAETNEWIGRLRQLPTPPRERRDPFGVDGPDIPPCSAHVSRVLNALTDRMLVAFVEQQQQPPRDR